MFTGLVQALGTVVDRRPAGSGLRLAVDLGALAAGGAGERPGATAPPPAIGDSIALSGVCCTVVRLDGAAGAFDLSPETLARTWLGDAARGHVLNLETALRAGQPLGGHLVQGHVDGVGRVLAGIDPVAGGELAVGLPAGLRRYCVEKGSLTLDGVSLTIAAVDGEQVRIAVIPHTAQVTTLGRARPGDRVHVEVDVIAKYVEAMLAARGLPSA